MSETSSRLPGLYLVSPSPGRVEGEIDLSGSSGDGHDDALLFAQQLIRQLIDEKVWSISSFSIDWPAALPRERLYGQAWLERKGATVHFIQIRFYDGNGTMSGSGSATAHQSLRPSK